MKPLPQPAQAGQHRPPDHRVTRHNVDGGRIGNRDKVPDRTDIGQHLELKIRLNHGLQFESIRTIARISKDNRNGVPLPHVPIRHIDCEGFPTGPGTHSPSRVVHR